MSRFARRIDGNTLRIVEALRAMGVSVEPRLARIGGGVPDLLCGYRGRNLLLEIKDGARIPSEQKLTEDELEWHGRWRGRVRVVKSPAEAIAAIVEEACRR